MVMKKLLLSSLSLLFMALLAGPVLGDETGTVSEVELIQRGRAALASNRWGAAESQFRLAVASDPTNSSAQAWLGYTLAGLHRHNEAITAFEQTLELDPGRTNTWLHLGGSYYAAGNFEKAADAYREYVSLNHDNARAYILLGNSLAQTRHYNEAKKACQTAITINPTNAFYYTTLGYCQAKLGRCDEATNTFAVALSLNPKDADAYLWLGICHYHAQAYARAVAALQKCVSIDPNDVDGYDWLGTCLYMLQRYDGAVNTLQKGLKISPDDFEMNYWLGRSYAGLYRYERAANAFLKAVRVRPNDFDAHDWRGICLVRLGRFDEAAASFQKAYELQRQDLTIRRALFCCYLLSSQYEQANRLYPSIFAFGGGALLLVYAFGATVLLRYTFRPSGLPSPGLWFSFAWLALFFEGQLALIFCLALLAFIDISQNALVGITLAGIPVIVAAVRAFARQPWGAPFAWPPRLGTARTIGLSLLWLILAVLAGSWCAEWIARILHHPVDVQEIVPIIKYALRANPVAAVVSVVIVGPIAEEIIFRGLIYGALEKRLRVAGAILVSSAIFAAVHLQPVHFIPIFCLGAALGWARWKTGSLGLPILLHILNNGVALVLLRFFEKGV